MPWRQDHRDRGKLAQHAAEGFQQQFLFAFGRTPASNDATIPSGCPPYRFRQARSGSATNIEFHVSAYLYPFRRRANGAQSLRISFGVCEKKIDLFKYYADVTEEQEA